MYCTKLLHHMWAKVWTMSFRGISEYHGIFSKRKKRPCINVGCRRPAVTFLSPYFPLPNRPVLNLTVRIWVQFLIEMKVRKWKIPPSPPSYNPSSSNEPPIKQEAEESCSQAPPQRPLVPLVLMILKQQIKNKTPHVKAELKPNIQWCKTLVWVSTESFGSEWLWWVLIDRRTSE